VRKLVSNYLVDENIVSGEECRDPLEMNSKRRSTTPYDRIGD